MNNIFIVGLIWSLILVTWAAWPESKKINHPARSIKNWLFTIWGIFLLLYAYLWYLQGGPIFFVILEILALIACVFMMLNTPDTIDVPIIAISSLCLIIWSLYLFEDYRTLIFIFGLSWIWLWYVFQMWTIRRNIALTLGSALIAIFSYIESSYIFFWLNIFFAIFSAYYLYKKTIQK